MEHEGGIDTQEQGAAVEWGALHGGGERQGPQDGPGHGRGGLLAEAVENISCWGRGRLSARVAGAWAIPCGWPGGEGLWGCTELEVGGSSLLAPVPSESQALDEWWAHLSHMQSCLLGPGVGPPPGQQRGRGGPSSRRAGWPHGFQGWAAAQVCRGHPGLSPRSLPPEALSVGRRQHWHTWLGPNGLAQGPGSRGQTERRAGSWDLAFKLQG